MLKIIDISSKNRFILSLALLWLAVWILPWGKISTVQNNLYLSFWIGMLLLAFALGAFIVPGALLYVLLKERNEALFNLWGLLPIGFSFSVLIIAIIGLTGRILGFSFELVKSLFALTGLVELLILIKFKPSWADANKYFSESFKNLFSSIALMLAIGLSIAMTFNEYLFFIDDTSYMAYLTTWQHASHLNFYNIVHHANVIEIERFWLALYPMGQALLSDLSGVPGILLLGNYLELLLVPLAVITAYWFAQVLGLSSRIASVVAVVQVMLYFCMIGEYWPAGFWFYINMAEDKVSAAFILAPVFFAFVLNFIQRPTKNNLIIILLSGLSITFTHPVILFFACAIAAGLGGFSWLARKTTWREILQLAMSLAILLIPYGVIRVVNYTSTLGFSLDAQNARTSFQVDRYTIFLNDFFYGLNPEVLKFFDLPRDSNFYNVFQVFRLTPIVIALAAGVISFLWIKRGPLYWYILSCVLLVTLATVPYTGWIIGFFVNARLISRAAWFSPLGLASVVVFIFVTEKFKTRPKTSGQPNKQFVETVVSIAILIIVLFLIALPHLSPYFNVLNHNRQLAQIGAYIDKNTEKTVTVIALDYRDILMLPGVSSHSSLISFREEKEDNGFNYFLSSDEIRARMYASNIIRSLIQPVSETERCSLINKFDVKYVLAAQSNVESYKNIVSRCKPGTEIVYETKEMALLQLK